MRLLVVGRLRPALGVRARLEGFDLADVRHGTAVTDALAEVASDRRNALVLCTVDDVRTVRREVEFASVALDPLSAVVRAARLPALGIAVLARVLEELRGHAGAGEQLACLDRLVDTVWCGLWLPSVSRIGWPTPSLSQHLRSWLPGAGFLLEFGAAPGVHSARRPPLPRLTAPKGFALTYDSQGVPGWVRRQLVEQVHPGSPVKFRSWREPRDAYGTDAVAEFVLSPPDPLAVLDDVRRTARFTDCDGCGQRHAAAACPFCAMAVRGDTPVSGGAS